MTVPDVQPMGVGEILDRSFQTLRHHFGTLFITALIGTVPYVLVFALALSPQADTADSVGAAMAFFGLALLMIPITALVWGALAWQVTAMAAGRPTSVGEGLRNGARSILRLIGAGIAAYVLFLLMLLPPALIGGVVMAVSMAVLGPGAASAVLTGIAFGVPMIVALIAFAAIVMLMVPVVVSDGAGPLKAISRANDLAKGGRVRVAATALVAWLVVMLPAIGIPFLFGVGVEMWVPEMAGTVSTTRLYLANLGSFLVGAVTTPFLVAVMVHAYLDRRVRREGYGMDLATPALGAEV